MDERQRKSFQNKVSNGKDVQNSLFPTTSQSLQPSKTTLIVTSHSLIARIRILVSVLEKQMVLGDFQNWKQL